MATITKRANGRFQAKIRRHGRTLSASFSSRADAEIWARKTESEIERGLYLDDLSAARAMIFSDAVDKFSDEHLARLSHAHRERNRAKALLERSGWGARSLASITPRDISDYIREREKSGTRPDTIRLDIACISRLYTHARRAWGMGSLKNPCDDVQRPSLRGTARTRRLEEGEEQKLLAAARSDFRPVILFALESAMRREEIASLTRGQIDFDRRLAHLPRTKNGEARTVPLSTRAIDILKPFDSKSNDDIIFGLSSGQITDRMRNTVKKSGLKNLRFHDLRHEATSRLFELGTMQAFEIATITGHKTLHMLKRYTHLRAEDLVKKLR